MNLNSINTSINNAANTFGTYAQQGVQLGQALNGLNNALNGMPTDYYTPASVTPPVDGKVTLQTLFTGHGQYMPNPLENKFSERLAWFGIQDSKEFVQAADAPWKRSLMSFLVGFGDNRTYIRNKIDEWAGQADLVRVGTTLNDARLMQVSGVRDASHLTVYNNPVHKSALYAAMGANAIQYNFYMPAMGAVSSAIDKAMVTPPVIRWQ